MNIGTLKTVSYLTSFGLLAGIGALGWDFYENGRDQRYFDYERADGVLNGVQPPEPPSRAGLRYVEDISPAIVDFDWTGKPPEERKAVEDLPTEDIVAVVTPVSEILEVLMVLGDESDPGESFCMVRFLDPAATPNTQWYAIGSTLPAPNETVSVAAILGSGVEFSFADKAREREFLDVSEAAKEALIVARSEQSEIVERKTSAIVRTGGTLAQVAPAQTEKRNGQYYLGTEDADLFQANYGEILSRDVRTETYFDENGKRAGVKLTDVREGSAASRLGAQSGDVIISINGSPVSSEQEAIQFVKTNSDRYDVWEVRVRNLGRERTEVYHSPGN
ncbi:MAG: PDZ domain-containing protein [Planctomycetota bacterium]